VSLAILDSLDDQQRAVAEAVEGPVVVRAGAGTGKTRAITHRIAYACAIGAHDPHRSLALTFTNRAAGEMRARLAGLGVEGVQVRTFHSAALRQLRYFWPRVVQGALPRIAPRSDGLFERAAVSANLRMSKDVLRQAREGIEALRLQRQSANSADVTALEAMNIDPAAAISLWRAYDQLKVDSGVIDFTDVLEVTAGMFAVHPELLNEVHRTYNWFTVDEYQDVSPLQWDLLRAWRGRQEAVCVVGDANQTIYGFAGATPSFLLGFVQEFPGALDLELTHCYRCTPQIIQRANALMAAAPTFMKLRSERPSGPEPDITMYADDRAEAEGIASAIAASIERGEDPRTIAVLFRTNAQSTQVQLAFANHGIPTVLRGGDRFFDRPEVKEAILRLRLASGPMPDAVVEVLGEMGLQDQPPQDQDRAKWESLSTIAAMARDDEWPDASAFVAHLLLRAQVEHVPVPYGVTLSTLHAAKGLEWSTVYLAGCSEGLLPIESAGADIDEERRLAYVGITRARDALHISWARARRFDGPAERICSRFFSGADIWGSSKSANVEIASVSMREHTGPAVCRVCGRALSTPNERTLLRCEMCPSQVDEVLREILVTWRSGVATQLGLPVFQVLTDQAIQAIAEHPPRNIDELRAIPGTRWLGDHGQTVLVLIGEAGYPLLED
jgi:DNA helicase-2/ATP-dependent DNA helicase PcrA